MKERYIFRLEGRDLFVFEYQVFEQNEWHTKRMPNHSKERDYNQLKNAIQEIKTKKIDHVSFGTITINQIEKDLVSVRLKNKYFIFVDFSKYKDRPFFRDAMLKISSQKRKQFYKQTKGKKYKLVRKKIANSVTSVVVIALITATAIHLSSGNKVFGIFNEKDQKNVTSSSQSAQSEIPEEFDESTITYENPMSEYDVEEIDDELIEDASLPDEQVEAQQDSQVIGEKTTESVEENNSQTVEENTDDFIAQVGKMYHMTREQALTAIETNQDIVEQQSNPELGMIRAVATVYWDKKDDWGLDQTPTVENLSKQEREQIIVDMAVLHGMDDEETLATILAIHRLETGHGTSNLCVYQNNQGGIVSNGSFLSYPTTVAGAESFVRTVKNRRNTLMGEGTYNYNNTLAENIKDYYCTEEMPGAGPWDDEVDNIKMSILENNELSNYNMDFGSNSK